MQQIERVGVVALLFLIVTIVVVAFWDDGQRAESTRVADRDARREQPSAEERVRADERGLRDDGRVASRQDRERLSAPVGRDDGAIPRPRADVPDPDRADRIARTAEARRERQAERERANAPGSRVESGSLTLELPHGRGLAEEERMLRRGYANAPTERTPVARVVDPATIQRAEPASRKQKPQAAPTAGTEGGTWVVKSGESLERIARQALGNGKRWPEIAKLNGIENPDKIIIGQTLQLPGQFAPAAVDPVRVDAPAAPKVAAAPAGGREYVVKKGDMLSVIAQRELGSAKLWKEIAALNPKVDPDRLLVGARLRLPAGVPAPARPVESRLVAQASRSTYSVR